MARRETAAGLACILALALGACRGRPAAVDDVVAYDLADRAWTADRDGPLVSVACGTPSAEPFLGGGFERSRDAAGTVPSVWLRKRAELWLPLPEGGAGHWLLLDLEPAAGLRTQALRAFLEGAPVARAQLAAGRRVVKLALPGVGPHAKARLQLLFDEAAEQRPGGGERRVAARLFGLTLGRGSATLDGLARDDAPRPLAVEAESGARRIVQAGDGGLVFALALPARATLRLTPTVRSGDARLRVSLEAEGGRAADAWSAALAAGESAPELALPLPGAPGSLVRVGLHVAAASPALPVVAWTSPRVTGAAPVPSLLDPPPRAATDERRAAGLRARLAGANVILIVLDAARARSFSSYGYGRRTTPEIDRIAAEGVTFERAYTPAVFTLSAMASVWTSREPLDHHAGVAYDDALPREPLTLAELLAAHGIHAAGFVANSMAGPAFGLDRGFAEFHEVHLRRGNRASAFLEVLPAWLEAHRAQRFFAYVHVREPHFPYDPQPPWNALFGPDAPLDRRARTDPAWYGSVNDGAKDMTPAEQSHLVRLYDGNLAYADSQVGGLRRELERVGLLERSVVIVTGDHGEALFEHGWIGHNQQVFEESTRIPLIVRFPAGSGPRGVRVRELADLVDLAPTIADVFGVLGRGGSGRAFRGHSLLPVALGAPGKLATVAVTTGEMRGFGLRHADWKYVRTVQFGVERLHDLARDPDERTDVAGAHPVRAAYYRQELHARILRAQGEAGGTPSKARLTPEQLENLRSLGYLE